MLGDKGSAMDQSMTATTDTDVKSTLAKTFLFNTLNETQLHALANQIWLEQIPEGSVVVREGDQADTLYVVVEGGVNVTKADGRFLAFLGPGGFFGEMALFLDAALRSATCVAAADTTCAVVRKSVLEKFCSDLPDAGLKIYRAIIRTLAERLQSTSADLAVLMSAQVRSQSSVEKMVESAKQAKAAAGKPIAATPLAHNEDEDFI